MKIKIKFTVSYNYKHVNIVIYLDKYLVLSFILVFFKRYEKYIHNLIMLWLVIEKKRILHNFSEKVCVLNSFC